ncbi:MAG: glutaredoxin family protein [Pseudohongiellaceae bacterium]
MMSPITESVVPVILYTTAGCHLCEQAEQLLSLLSSQRALVVDAVDISTDEALVRQYGIRIPVLLRPDGAELSWPFDIESLEVFLRV